MRWLSSKEVPNTPKIHSVALPTWSPEHRKQSTRIDLPVKPFPSVSSESSDDMPSFFSFGSRHREARVSNNLITPTVINDEPRTRTRSNSMKPLKGILKAAAHHSPEATPILMPRPRKASRSSPVEMIEHAVHTRAPSRMQTPIETRPTRAPSGRPQEAAPVHHHHAFPPKPSRATHPIDATPGVHVFPAQIPTQRDRHRVDPTTPHFNFPPKPPSHVRPSTAMDNYPTHRSTEKPAKSSHRHKSSNSTEKERKHKDRNEDKDKRHKRREEKTGDRQHRVRDDERVVQTDNEDWARPRDAAETCALPYQVEKIPLDGILLPEPIMVKTKSKEWKEKLSIRYNITKNPYSTVIDRWNIVTKRYEPIDRAEYHMSMAPCRLITHCYIVTASTPVYCETISDATGVHCVDILNLVFRCYNHVLTSREREIYKDVMQTDEFRRWFNYRCQQAENPEEERKLGPKRVDLLQGNVFYKGVKYLGSNTWEVQMYTNLDNSLYFAE